MFRASQYVDRIEDLKEWEEWFTKRGIKTEIRRDPGRGPALYREGNEAIYREGKERKKPAEEAK
jgi:hypothetical protein